MNKKTSKQKDTVKQTKKINKAVITDVEVEECSGIISPIPPSIGEKMEKVREGRERSDKMRKAIQSLLPKGVVEDLQAEVLENWAEMLTSDDLHIWAMATKELSKYLFPQKREHQIVPAVNINCTFNGIMTQDAMGGKVINDQSDDSLLEKVKTDLMAQVAQIDILLHNRKGKRDA